MIFGLQAMIDGYGGKEYLRLPQSDLWAYFGKQDSKLKLRLLLTWNGLCIAFSVFVVVVIIIVI